MNYSETTSAHYINKLWNLQKDLLNQEAALREKTKRDTLRILGNANMYYESDHPTHNVFQTRVRPAIQRGKTLILATDPEKHVQLVKERQALQEQRTRPRTPVKLIPIQGKSLSKPETSNKENRPKSPPQVVPHPSPTRLSENYSQKTSISSILSDEWNKSLPIISRTLPSWNSRLYRGDTIIEPKVDSYKSTQYMKSLLHLEPITKSLGTSPSLMRSENNHKLAMGKQRKPQPGFGIYNPATRHREPTFLLEASSIRQNRDSLTIDSIAEAQRCCNNDEDCIVCGQYASKLPVIPFISKSLPARCEQSSTSPVSSITSSDSRKTIVIQLPTITYLPATPPRSKSADNIHIQKARKVSYEKALKQRQLRQKELTNLFADIKELNNYNEEIKSNKNKRPFKH